MSLARFGWIPPVVRIYGLLLLLSLACLALGYSLEHRQAAPMVVHIVNEIGIAGLIGFLLAITIEKLSQSEFRKLAAGERALIKKDVFYYVYGHDIPEAIRTEIDSTILKSHFARKGVVMKYELEPIEDPVTHEWYVDTNCTMKYDIENLTPVDQAFPFVAAIDKSPSEALANRTKFIKLSAQGCRVPFDWDETAARNHQTEADNEYVIELLKEIVVAPKQQPPATTNLTTIRMETHSVRFLKGGHIDFTFTSHICDLELMIQADKRLKVSAHTFDQNPLIPGDLNSPPSGFYHWKLNRPLLANQSLKVGWTPEGIPPLAVKSLQGDITTQKLDERPSAVN